MGVGHGPWTMATGHGHGARARAGARAGRKPNGLGEKVRSRRVPESYLKAYLERCALFWRGAAGGTLASREFRGEWPRIQVSANVEIKKERSGEIQTPVQPVGTLSFGPDFGLRTEGLGPYLPNLVTNFSLYRSVRSCSHRQAQRR